MLSHRSSRTAEGATLIRLLQQQLPQQQRILHDPWVSSIGLLAHRWLARIPFFAQFCLKVLPRMVDYVPVRDRFADEVVAQALSRGVRQQVVVLGAGLDTIAYRVLAKEPATVVYEVDHPATQLVKRRRVRHLVQPHGNSVRYVAADFERDDFRTSLQASGFQADQDCVVIWMGVLYYLTEEAVQQTLTKARTLMTPGSTLAFDFWPPSLVQPSSDARLEARRRAYGRLGEPLKFGIDPVRLPEFVAPLGFDVDRLESVAALNRRYVQRDMSVPEGMSLATLVARDH